MLRHHEWRLAQENREDTVGHYSMRRLHERGLAQENREDIIGQCHHRERPMNHRLFLTSRVLGLAICLH